MRRCLVAPYTGAWIEIFTHTVRYAFGNKSHPTRVRGLKLPHECNVGLPKLVAPYTGAWIEICSTSALAARKQVAPYTGAWIEIYLDTYRNNSRQGRTLHGCVD